jgi:D-sedoheptulose 7-phosphate isomerase
MKHQDDNQSLYVLLRDRIQSNIELKKALLNDVKYQDAVTNVALQIVDSLRAGGKVFFFGNGGSAADAQHLTAEFTGRYLKERPALPALALSVNSSSVTAIGNDYGYDLVFARQLEALGKPGDVAVGISTSGNSPNVVRALQVAKDRSIYAVALTGGSGGKMKTVADCTICIPSNETPRIQECHILTGHIICEIAELMLSDDSSLAIQKDNLAEVPAARAQKPR